MKTPFHGRTYIYPTPNAGPREIGVTEGLGRAPIVAWLSPTGAKKRVKTKHLPAGIPAADLQTKLDAWAATRRLKPANVEREGIVTIAQLIGCARCGGNHGPIEFSPLARPCGDLTHWAKCPTNGEPILMQ